MMQRLTPVVKNLIFVNVAFFAVLYGIAGANLPWADYFPLHNLQTMGQEGVKVFRPYQLVTTMFTHFGIGHLFFNMLGLFFFGPILEQRIGGKKMFLAYILGGLFSAIVFLLFYSFVKIQAFSLLGASGAVYTILVLCAFYYPKMRVQLIFPPVALTISLMVILYIGVDAYQFLSSARTGTAHLAHLGGAAMGGILYFFWEKFRR